MRSLVRLVLLWLLALALPAQGIAAASQLHCGRVEQTAATHAAHLHHHHQADAGQASLQHAAHHHTTDAAGCSACAACCMGLALPSLPPVLASQEAAQSAPRAAAFPAPLFLTGGPERPPRAALA